MKLARVKRWQWVVASLALGVALAWANTPDQATLLANAGRVVTNRRWFEREIRREVPLADGRAARAFRDLRVRPAWIDEGDGGPRRRVDLVTGLYLVETRADPATGQVTGQFRRYTFVAPVPYGNGADTVTAYLDRTGDVAYAQLWWADPRYAALLWVGGSVVMVGLVWPTLVNLMAYGTWRRPAEGKGVDLRSVVNDAPPRHTSGDLTPDELQRLAAFEAHVKGGLAAAADGGEPEAAVVPAIRPLVTTSLDTPKPVASAAAKDFGASAEDYYPTELKARPTHHD